MGDVPRLRRRAEELGETLRDLPVAYVVTHGDPNLANIVIDMDGDSRLVDWGDVGLGPAERDLFAFKGLDFRTFLRQYVSRRSGPLQLSPEMFEFYECRWTLQEISDYSTRILFNYSNPRGQRA